MNVQDIWLFKVQPFAEPCNITQSAQPLFTDGPVQVFGAAAANPVTEGTIGCDHGYPVVLCGRKFAQFGGDQL